MKPALISHAWQGEEDVVVRTKLSNLSDLRSSVTVAWLETERGACFWVLWCCDKVGYRFESQDHLCSRRRGCEHWKSHYLLCEIGSTTNTKIETRELHRLDFSHV